MSTEPKTPTVNIGTKGLGPLEIVDDAKGEVTAVVYTLGEVDRDREVILPGAFPSGVRVKLSGYGHSAILAQMRGTGQPVEAPVGKGVITIEGNRAVFRGNFFMTTERGREAYATTKEMGPEQEWSFSYWIRDGAPADEEWRAKGAKFMLKTIDPFEASPVTVSSSLGTRTVGVKCEGCGEPHEGEACAPCVAKAAELAAKEQEAKVAAEERERAGAATELARIADAARQAEESRLVQEAAVKQAATEEFERFERTRRRLGVG